MSKTIPKIKLPILYKKIAQNKNFVKLAKALYWLQGFVKN